MSSNVRLKMHAGKSKTLIAQVYKYKSNIIQPINGSTIKWILYKDNTIHLTKLYPSGIDHVDLNSGRFNILLNPVDTQNLAPSVYSHECEITDSLGNVSIPFYGKFVLLKSLA